MPTNAEFGMWTSIQCKQPDQLLLQLEAFGPVSPDRLDLLFHVAMDHNSEACFRLLLKLGKPPKRALEQAIGQGLHQIARALFEEGERHPLSSNFVEGLFFGHDPLETFTFFWPYFNLADHTQAMQYATACVEPLFSFFVERCDLTPTVPTLAEIAQISADRAKPECRKHLLRMLGHADLQADGGMVLQALALNDLDWAMAGIWERSDLVAVHTALSTGHLAKALLLGESKPEWAALDCLGTQVNAATRTAWLRLHPGLLPRSLAKDRQEALAQRPGGSPSRRRTRS